MKVKDIILNLIFLNLCCFSFVCYSKVYYLTETHAPLLNPFKGFYTNVSTKLEDLALPQSMAYSGFTWKDLEGNKRNGFNWKHIEKDWAWHTNKNRNIIIRFKVADPWSKDDKDYPDWLKEFNSQHRRYFIDGGTGIVPNWDSNIFLKEHRRAILALGKRYDKDPRIAWVEVGSYGIWGEWHMYQNEHLSARVESKLSILNSYIKAFPNKDLVIPFDDSFALEYMIKRGVGVRNDCLGKPDSNKWFLDSIDNLPKDVKKSMLKDRFIVGEFCGGEQGAHFAMKNYKNENMNFIKRSSWSSIGPAGGSFLLSDKNEIRELYKSLGYRFVLLQSSFNEKVLKGQDLNLKLNLKNHGVASFPKNWTTKIYIKDSEGKILINYSVKDRGWLSSEWKPGIHNLSTTLPLSKLELNSGTYSMFIGIEDPDSLKPNIQFANINHDNNKRFFIGTFSLRVNNENNK
jgi:hypothetical protein